MQIENCFLLVNDRKNPSQSGIGLEENRLSKFDQSGFKLVYHSNYGVLALVNVESLTILKPLFSSVTNFSFSNAILTRGGLFKTLKLWSDTNFCT